MAIRWDSVCGNSSAFWDSDLSWNATVPDFTDCFQNTALIWTPCLVLWLFLPLELYCLKHSRAGNIRWNFLNITKQVTCTALLILFIVKLIVATSHCINGKDTPVVDFLSPIIMIASLFVVNVLIYYERKRGVQSSALLFCFWFFLVLAGALTFHSYLMQARYMMTPEKEVNYSIFMIYYPLVVALFILSIFKDADPLFRNPDDVVELACPLNSASFLSKLTFSWLDGLLWLGFRRSLELSDVWKASPEVMTKNTVPEFLHHWKNTTRKLYKLQIVLWKSNWPLFLKGWSCRLLGDVLIYMSPLLLNYFIAFVSGDEPTWHGYVYIIVMFVAGFAESLAYWHGAFYGLTILVKVQSSFISMIYRKCLTLCNSCKLSTTTGEIINHIAVDVEHVTIFVYDLVLNATFPVQICTGLYLLYNLLGVAAFAGLGAMIVMILVSGIITHELEKVEIKQLRYKDQRIKQINETIIGIKVLKLFAWEKPFVERISGIRHIETVTKRRGLIFQGAMTLMWRVSTLTVSLVCFTTYIMLDKDNVVNPTTAFITIMLVYILSNPMMRLPMLVTHFVQHFSSAKSQKCWVPAYCRLPVNFLESVYRLLANWRLPVFQRRPLTGGFTAYVSLVRLNKFMSSKDLDSDMITHKENDEFAVRVKSSNFTWDLNELPILTNIDLKIPEGSLVAVVGPVGCGKSSLISAILGEMESVCGSINAKGTVAYVPQQAWIQNATVKENILFSKKFQEEFYKTVIKACALEPDLAILPGGDETEIGEKGINLSGGQKQRVSLARAIFNDADIYLLDDPLSAVDPHVGEHIFEKVIGPNGLLKNKTRVLVTHGITHLPKVDQIIVLLKGCITEIGTHSELMDKNGAFSEFLATYGQANSPAPNIYNRKKPVISKALSIDEDNDPAGGCKLTTTEHLETGEVNKSVYFLYIKYVGIWGTCGIVTLMAVSMSFSASSQIWLSIWSADPVSPNEKTRSDLQNMRLGVYATLELLNGSFLFLGILTLVYTSMKAAINLHSKMLWSIIQSPLSFFDTTPSGRIVNRFSKDVDTVDSVLPNSCQDFLVGILEILTAAIVICIKLPWLMLVLLPISVLYYLMQKFFIKTASQLRRLESITRSPIYSRFSETIAGVSTVRAFRLQDTFVQQFDEMLDTNLKNRYHSRTLSRWIGIRLGFLGNILLLFTALFALLQRESMTANTIGLIVTYAHAMNFTFCWLVYNAGLLETNIISIERLHEYISLKPEAPWEQPDNKPSSLWPVEGTVQFENFSTQYRKGLPPILHGLTCKILNGEKIGVVGRTGAGKTTITLSLFRIIEATEGTIFIDGVDISKIGLHDLRNRLTIIPQDPVLYSGPLRMNLDPFDQHTDSELWKALELAHLKDYISTLAAGLLHEIAEGGENLSVGQRQLVCLARAVLRKTKILILDEATAAVDLATDDLIQATIHQEFAECTVITIAHRINTIMDSSRVIVMDNGSIREFDKPSILLNDKKSLFYSMANFSGIVE